MPRKTEKRLRIEIWESCGFHYSAADLRTLTDDNGDPWFVAKDVAEILGYAKPQNAVKQHCKHPKLLKSPESGLLDIPSRGLTIIRESDVYRLVMRSKLPGAEKFEEWVMEEVLPSIRKKGGYMVAGEDESPAEIMARAVMIAQDTIKKREKTTIPIELVQ